MKVAERCLVVLLSREPRAHRDLVARLRGTGAEVRVPRGAQHARPLLGRRPDYILVDLVHGAGLTPSLVHGINRRRTPGVVLALHDGSLGPFHREAANLSVEGFCHARDPRPLVHVVGEHHPAMSSVLQ